MNKSQQVDENLLGRFLHNQKLKLFFSKTYIKKWAAGGYKWEKTPATPENLNISLNALNDLQVYYTQVDKDPKKLQKAQGGVFSAFFAGFWTKVFQKMAGNTTKMDAIGKFNAEMSRVIPRLYQQLTNFFQQVDKEIEKNGSSGGPVGSVSEGTAPADKEAGQDAGKKDGAGTDADKDGGTDKDADKKADADKEGGDAAAAEKDIASTCEKITKKMGDLLEKAKTADKKNAKKFEKAFTTALGGSEKGGEAFSTKCGKIVKDDESFKDNLSTVLTKLEKLDGTEGAPLAFYNKLCELNVDTPEKLIDCILDFEMSNAGEGGDALAGINAFYQAMSTANDANESQIKWENGGLDRLSNLYMAENSLYKIVVFLGAWVDSVNKGIWYDKGGAKQEIDTEQLMEFLKTPIGKSFTNVSQTLNDVNTKFSQQSAFGTLKESEIKQLKHEYAIYEHNLKTKQKQMSRTNEALARLKKCMEMEDEQVKETSPQDLAPEEPITTEDEHKEEADAMASKLRKLADARKVREERIKKGHMKVVFGDEVKEDTGSALGKLAKCMEQTEEPAKMEQPETLVVKEPNAEPKKEHLGIEVVFGDEVSADKALKSLQKLVYDGDVPEVEVPVDEGSPAPAKKPEDEQPQDEVIEVVTEAPGDPNDPNAVDPNAAADPNADLAADPAAAMDTSDLGAPPVDPADPTAGGTVDPDAAGGADPNAAAPAPDAGAAPADPNAAGGAAPADPNAAGGAAPAEPAPDQQNVAGQAPNAAGTENGEQNKYDIGATKPFNQEGEELHLTDQEQEQLFTKINLLTKIPDLVNYGKYFYNITPENVSLDDIHYINDLYELSVKLGLLTDDFEGNNLLEKYNSYKFTVLSKNPEQALISADQQGQAPAVQGGQPVAETTKKVKTENAGEVTIVNAPGLVIAKDVDDYMKQKDEANAEAHGEITFKGTLDRARGLGSLVTFAGVLFGYPVVKTLYLKGAPESNKITKEKALEQLKKQGYADVEILAIEPIDPIDYLYHEYAGMRTLEDEFTREYMKQRLEKRVARNLKKLNESVESKSIIPQEFDDDIGKIVDTLNKEIMEDPTIDLSKDIGLPKMMVTKEDFEKCYTEAPVTEGDDDCDCTCQFCVTKTGASNLSRVLFSSNCQRICKCLEGIAHAYGYNLKAIAEGDDILKGADKITLTFSK